MKLTALLIGASTCSGLHCALAFVATKAVTPGIQLSRIETKKRLSFLELCTYRDRRSRSVVHSSTPAGNDDPESTTTQWPAITKAALLIAGTTIGGGFLALPQTVVVPLGGFPVTAASLSFVWVFLLAQSWILCRSIVQCHQETGRDGLGITYLAQHVLGAGRLALFLLVVLTEATLVSQLARAGILFAAAGSSVARYQAGCALAAVTGGILSLGSNKIATNSNALLTTVFLGAAALLFQAGQSQADWSKCLVSTSTVTVTTVAKAIPTMLQLLVYGEILPNVCRMLNYKLADIRTALALGSFIPLILLSGWAALGVALLPTLSASIDPVTILLQNSGAAIQNRLTTLAIAAIGTTILGSFLALQSAYNDVATEAGKEWLQRPVVSTLALVVPPLGISLISPSLFFKAIDFAGAYPVLLLFGVLPPLVSYRMNGPEKKFTWSAALGLLSAGMVGLAAVKDGTSIVTKLLSFVAT